MRVRNPVTLDASCPAAPRTWRRHRPFTSEDAPAVDPAPGARRRRAYARRASVEDTYSTTPEAPRTRPRPRRSRPSRIALHRVAWGKNGREKQSSIPHACDDAGARDERVHSSSDRGSDEIARVYTPPRVQTVCAEGKRTHKKRKRPSPPGVQRKRNDAWTRDTLWVPVRVCKVKRRRRPTRYLRFRPLSPPPAITFPSPLHQPLAERDFYTSCLSISSYALALAVFQRGILCAQTLGAPLPPLRLRSPSSSTRP